MGIAGMSEAKTNAVTIERGATPPVHLLAGKPAPANVLIDQRELCAQCYSRRVEHLAIQWRLSVKATHKLYDAGQSLRLDNITRADGGASPRRAHPSAVRPGSEPGRKESSA